MNHRTSRMFADAVRPRQQHEERPRRSHERIRSRHGRCGSLAGSPAQAAQAAQAAAPAPITIVVFTPPSLGAIFPAVIKQQKFDIANGIDITFVERTPDAYAVEFNSGEFEVGGSASVLIVGLADTRGVKVTYLFNLFDFWGPSSAPAGDQDAADLEGKELAAARGTTNYVMFDWFAKQLGRRYRESFGDQYRDARPYRLCAGRSRRRGAALGAGLHAVETKKPDIRTIDIDIAKSLEEFAGSGNIPYLGVAAHIDWVDKHRHLIPELYRGLQGSRRLGDRASRRASKLIAREERLTTRRRSRD